MPKVRTADSREGHHSNSLPQCPAFNRGVKYVLQIQSQVFLRALTCLSF